MSDFEWKREGDDFTYIWNSVGIAISVSNIHESREDLFGEFWVKTIIPDQPAHIHWGRHNIASIQSRDKLVASLTKRQGLEKMPWTKMLETVCTRTAIEWRRGEPVISLATGPRPQGTKYLVSRLLPTNSVSIIFGDGSSCKSMLSLLLGIGVTLNLRMPNGLTVSDPGPVLYLDWETCYDDQRERLQAMTLGLDLRSDTVKGLVEGLPEIHYRRQFRKIADDCAQLKAEVARLGAKLVIIDSLGPAVGGGIRDEEQAIPAMNAIRSLGCTALVLAHITKADARGDNGTKVMPIGSIFFANLARSTWEAKRSESSIDNVSTVALYHRKANRGPLQRDPIGFNFTFHNNGDETEMIEVSRCDVAEEDDLAEHAPLPFRLQAFLRTGAKSAGQLSEMSKAKLNTVEKSLKRLEHDNKIVRLEGRGGSSVWGLRNA